MVKKTDYIEKIIQLNQDYCVKDLKHESVSTLRQLFISLAKARLPF